MMPGFFSCIDTFGTVIYTSPAVTTMRQVFPLYGKVRSSYVIIESLHTEIKFMPRFCNTHMAA